MKTNNESMNRSKYIIELAMKWIGMESIYHLYAIFVYFSI